MKIYYSITDPAPAYRSDLAELFGGELAQRGLQTEWFMKPAAGGRTITTVYGDQVVHVPRVSDAASGVLKRLAYWAWDCIHLLRVRPGSVDAIQCRDKYLGAVFGLLISRIRGVPFFYWCSYPFPEHQREVASLRSGPSRLLGKAKAALQFRLLYHFICRRADHVFVQSDQMLADMRHYGVPASRMTPVPMGVPARIASWRQKNQVDVVPGRIVYLGSLARIRRLGEIVQAFARVAEIVPSAHLLVVGDGDHPSERQDLERLANDLGLADRITFTGFVPMEEAWRLTASASLCLSPFYPTPTLRSASPTKLIEYMALGRPVLCNDHPEQSHIIRESGAGLCVPWTVECFSDGMLRVLSDPAAAEAMAARGPSWVHAHRTYPVIAEAVLSKYRELLEAGA
jgi:glycosyltransferase involved in cell wall biosynthesis